MDDATFRIMPIDCRLSQLRAIAPSPNPSQNTPQSEAQPGDWVNAVALDQPFSLQITVEFLRRTAIALLQLSPHIRIDFYAKPVTTGEGCELGTVAIATRPDQMTYTLTLEVASPADAGLTRETIYRVGAMLRLGAPGGPALISGVIESLLLEMYGVEGADFPHHNADGEAGAENRSAQSAHALFNGASNGSVTASSGSKKSSSRKGKK